MLNLQLNRCIYSIVALAFIWPAAISAQDIAQDRTRQECQKMELGHFSTGIIINEQKEMKTAANKEASCSLSCMSFQHYSRQAAVAQGCSRVASTERMKIMATTIIEQSSGLLIDSQKLVSTFCDRGCPEKLPPIEQTAFGVAAAFKVMNGEVTPQQVRAYVRNTIDEISKNGKMKFQKKPLSQYELDAYNCAYTRAYQDRTTYEVLRKSPNSTDIFVAIADCVEGDK